MHKFCGKIKKVIKVKVKEIIVVEGKADTRRLKEVFKNIDTIETRGSAIDERTLELIAEAQKSRGVIIFTDPDYQGQKIRSIINNVVPDCKNAYINKEKAIDYKKHKVGVEHCLREDLIESLSNITEVSDNETNVTFMDLYNLKLVGCKNSNELRDYLSDKLHLGNNNAKQFCKKIKMFNISLETIKDLSKEYENRQAVK